MSLRNGVTTFTEATSLILSQDDLETIALAACSLEKVPGNQNWVDSGGGLP